MEICKYSWARKRWHQCPELNRTTAFLHCSVCQLMQWQFCCYRAEAFIRDYQYWEEIIIRLCIYVSLSSKGFHFNRKKLFQHCLVWTFVSGQWKHGPGNTEEQHSWRQYQYNWSQVCFQCRVKQRRFTEDLYWVLCSVQGVLEGEMQNKMYYYRKILTWVEFAKSVCHPSEQNRGAQR